ncbi:MAG: ATP-binding protein, partial [Acidobacteriota bacterium]
QRSRILHHEIQDVQTELRAREQEALRTAKLVAMGELAARVAHQIRNPLNAIHMTAQQMERDLGRGEMSAEQAARVRGESRRIEGIIQQFLELARPRMPQWQSFDVGALVADCVHAAEASFQAAKIGLEPAIASVTAEVDREFLIEIVENLLYNAKQASPAGGRVRVAVQKAGSEVEIIVEDQGPGVPAQLCERIFDPYFTTRPSGTGLGLSLVAQMAAAMGGGVRLENPAQSGARFKVWLPRKRAQERNHIEGTGACK